MKATRNVGALILSFGAGFGVTFALMVLGLDPMAISTVGWAMAIFLLYMLWE